MKWLLQLRCPGYIQLLLSVLLSSACWAQMPAQSQLANDKSLAIVNSVRALPAQDGAGVEIVSSRPLVPTISKLENPSRLVIDLPQTRLGQVAKRVEVHSAAIQSIRLSQFQENPPVARVVVDLTGTSPYSWEATGNLLIVRLATETAHKAAGRASPSTTAGPPTNVAQNEIPTLGGSRLPAGSSVTAGADAAVVSLGRGGQVRVCPGTTVSVTSSQNNRSLMLGMSTGAIEAHYKLEASADSIMTPDFRILLAGPGEFHYAFSADSHGNTCIQALPGNTASVIVSELLGDGTYQVKPNEQVMLRSGQLKNVDMAGSGGCGCPAPTLPVMLASATPASSAMKSQPAAGTSAAGPTSGVGEREAHETAALPASKPDDVHVQVEAPFVFRGDDPEVAQPPAIVKLETLPLRSPEPVEPFPVAVLAPPQTKPEHHGFFGKLRGFFSAVFG
jgi:hypothetical protein